MAHVARRGQPLIAGIILTFLALLGVWAVLADVAWFERHVASQYCVSGPTWPWQMLRAAALVTAALLALVVRPRLQAATAQLPAREIAITSFGIFLALLASAGVAEVVLRRIEWDTVPQGRNVPEIRADPRLSWALGPGQARRFAWGGRPFDYFVDGRGDRIAAAGREPDRLAPTLVVHGESLAFGYDLDWAETWGAQVGRALGLEVVNLGVPAYANDQAYVKLLDELPGLAQPKLVVSVFVPQQVRRNISPARPHFILKDGALKWVPAATGFAAWRLARLFNDQPFHGDEAIRVTRAILLATAAAARARGAEVLFVVTNYGVPCRAISGKQTRLVEKLFVETGLPWVRVELGAEDWVAHDDPHASPQGARKIAEAILGRVRL